MGSVTIVGWIATLVFPAVLIAGVLGGEISRRAMWGLLLCAAAVWFGLPRVPTYGVLLVTPALAILDIVLVLMVFKGDVRLT